MFSVVRKPSVHPLSSLQCFLALRQALVVTPTRPRDSRLFSSSLPNQSRIGRAPIPIPPGVQVNVLEPKSTANTSQERRVAENRRIIEVQGPLGNLSLPIPDFVQVAYDNEGKKLMVSVLDRNTRKQREMWGTVRARLYNNILGVSEGHAAILRLNGVGYRASIEPTAVHQTPAYSGQQFLSLKLGYSHPVDLPIPERVKTSTPQPTRILLEGADKDEVTQFAAEIRGWKRPEPYKGKGIFLGDETIRLKAKKIK